MGADQSEEEKKLIEEERPFEEGFFNVEKDEKYVKLKGERDQLFETNEKLMSQLKRKKRKIEELEKHDTTKDEPPKKKVKLSQPSPCVVFSGFKATRNKFYSVKMRKRLTSIVNELGGTVYRRNKGITNEVTHIVAPPSSRTMKVMQGVMKGAWIVNSMWLLESQKQKGFVPEGAFGFRKDYNPVGNQKFFLSESFAASSGAETVNNCKQLLLHGDGILVNDPSVANFILICSPQGEDDEGEKKIRLKGGEEADYESEVGKWELVNRKATTFHWDELLSVIYPTYLSKRLVITDPGVDDDED